MRYKLSCLETACISNIDPAGNNMPLIAAVSSKAGCREPVFKIDADSTSAENPAGKRN